VMMHDSRPGIVVFSARSTACVPSRASM
jgi:hypothetical protein